jgi:ABC-type dipeptide/oligopeptide/nickel transport system permease subunit
VIAGPHTLWKRSPRATVGLALVGLILALAILAPLIAPYATTDQNVDAVLQPPSLAHLFGTDEFGQDVFSRVLFGGRPTLLVAGATVLASLLIGVPLGLISGYLGGTRDLVIMRIVEFGFSIPALVLAIAIIAFLGPGAVNVVVALTIVYAPLLARVARAATLSLRQRPFILAAEAIGERTGSIMVRQVAPNIAPPVLVQGTLVFAFAILAEASLSFLGLGTQEPNPSWGRMLKEALPLAEVAPWMGIFPGVFIAATVIGLNLVGDGLRDLLDPRSRASVDDAAAEGLPVVEPHPVPAAGKVRP